MPVSATRLHILRAYYLLIIVGTGAVFWPSLLSHTPNWGIENGAQYALLSALTPFALLGLRFPLQMLPIVFFEFIWKALWFIFVFAPLWTNDQMTPLVWDNAFACSIAIVLTPFVIPWSHMRDVYTARALPATTA